MRFRRLLPAVLLLVSACSGLEDRQLLRSRATGIVAERGIEPAPFSIVFIEERPLDAAISYFDGRFHLVTEYSGPATLSAIDTFGYSATQGINLKPGQGLDLGVVPLGLCLSNGETTPDNSGAFGECPEDPLGKTPLPSLTLSSFEGDVTDIARVDAPLPSLSVQSKSFGQNMSLNLLIPEDSSAYGAGTANVGFDTFDSSSTFIVRVGEDDKVYVYPLLETTAVVQTFEPHAGGEITMQLNGATFAWFDPVNLLFDLSSTIQIQTTGDSIHGVVYNPPGPGQEGQPTPTSDPGSITPPSNNISVTGLGAPAFNVIYAEPDGSASLLALFDISATEQLILDIRIPDAVTGAATRSVGNTIDGPASDWSFTVPGVATYVDDGATYKYIFESGTISLTGGGQSGQSLQIDLVGTNFVFTPDFQFAFPGITLHVDGATVSSIVTQPNQAAAP